MLQIIKRSACVLAVTWLVACAGGGMSVIDSTGSTDDAGDDTAAADSDTITISGTLSLTGDDNTDASITSAFLTKSITPRYVVALPGATKVYLKDPDGNPVLDDDGNPIEGEADGDGNFEFQVPRDKLNDEEENYSVDSNVGIKAILKLDPNLDVIENVALNPDSTLGAGMVGDTLQERGYRSNALADGQAEMDVGCFYRLMSTMAAASENTATPDFSSSLRTLMNVLRAAAITGFIEDEYYGHGGVEAFLYDITHGNISDADLSILIQDAVNLYGGDFELLNSNFFTLMENLVNMREITTDYFLPNLQAVADTGDADPDEVVDPDAITYDDVCNSDSTIDVAQIILQFNVKTYIQLFEYESVVDFQMQSMNRYAEAGTKRLPEGLSSVIAGTMEVLPKESFSTPDAMYPHMDILRTQPASDGIGLRAISESYVAACMANPTCVANPQSTGAQNILGTANALAAGGVVTTLADRSSRGDFVMQMNQVMTNSGATYGTNVQACITTPSTCNVSITSLMTGLSNTPYMMFTGGQPINNTTVASSDQRRGIQVPQQQPPQQQQGGGGGGTGMMIPVTHPGAPGRTVICIIDADTNPGNGNLLNISAAVTGTVTTCTFTPVQLATLPPGSYYLSADLDTDGNNTVDQKAWFGTVNGVIPSSPTFVMPRPMGATQALTTYVVGGGGGGGGGGTSDVTVTFNHPISLTNKTVVVRIDNDTNPNNGQTQILTINTNGTSTVANFTGIAAGNHHVYAIADLNGNNILDAGDLQGWAGSPNENAPVGGPTFTMPRPQGASNTLNTFTVPGGAPPPSLQVNATINNAVAGLTNGASYNVKISIDNDTNPGNGVDANIVVNAWTFNAGDPRILVTGASPILNGPPIGNKYIKVWVDKNSNNVPDVGDPMQWVAPAPGAPTNIAPNGITTVNVTVQTVI